MEDFYSATIAVLEPQTLQKWIEESRDRFVVVDVRDSDYKFAHIKGSIHSPYKAFDNTAITRLLTAYPLSQDYTYVFHCMRSQQRGPTCAKRFVRYLYLHTEVNRDLAKMPKVYLLNGGMKKWNQLYGADPTVTEPL